MSNVYPSRFTQAQINAMSTDRLPLGYTVTNITTNKLNYWNGTGWDILTGTVTPDTTVQKVEVAKAGTLVSTRKKINFIEGTNVTLTIADDSGNNRANVTIAATGGGVTAHDDLTNRDIAGNHAKLIPAANGTTAIQITQADGSTVVLNADTTNKIVGLINAIINYGHATESFEITERGVSLGFPVATIRPVTANKNAVIDLMPNGTPAEFTTNGIAWFDICNADAKGASPSMNCARIGIYTASALIAALSYNGATDVPLEFAIGTTGNVVARFATNGDLELLTDATVGSTLKTASNNASYYGNLATFRDNLTYDSNKFQGVTRLLAVGKPLVLCAENATAGDIIFITGGGTITSNERMRITAAGVPTIKGSTLNIETQKTPTSASATGTKGDICHDTNYIYVCTATNTWKRAQLSSW